MLCAAPALLFPLLASLLAALVLTRAMMFVAPHLGYLDHPSPRKAHRTPTPLLGGVAVFSAFLAALGLTYLLFPSNLSAIFSPPPFALILAASLTTLTLGLYDDRKILRPLPKFLSSCLASALPLYFLCATNATLFEYLALAAALVFFSHAFNLLDNSDGQCASVAAAALAAAAFHSPMAVRLAALGALLGFLWWNRPPARIFLGDAGSLLLGAWCVLLVLRDPTHAGFQINPRLLTALWIPLYDTLSVIALRLWQDRPIWQGGQDHLAWRLMRRGLSPHAVNCILALATLLPAICARLLSDPLTWLLLPCLLIGACSAELATIAVNLRRARPHVDTT